MTTHRRSCAAWVATHPWANSGLLASRARADALPWPPAETAIRSRGPSLRGRAFGTDQGGHSDDLDASSAGVGAASHAHPCLWPAGRMFLKVRLEQPTNGALRFGICI